MDEIKIISQSPMKELTKGLGSSIAREGLYTLFHYSTYRYLKDIVFNAGLKYFSVFIYVFNIFNFFDVLMIYYWVVLAMISS